MNSFLQKQIPMLLSFKFQQHLIVLNVDINVFQLNFFQVFVQNVMCKLQIALLLKTVLECVFK